MPRRHRTPPCRTEQARREAAAARAALMRRFLGQQGSAPRAVSPDGR